MDTLVSILASGDGDGTRGAAAGRFVQLVRERLLPALNASFFLAGSGGTQTENGCAEGQLRMDAWPVLYLEVDGQRASEQKITLTYEKNPRKILVEFDSSTLPHYQKRKYNLMLRCVVIMCGFLLAQMLPDTEVVLSSVAASKISSYVCKEYFGMTKKKGQVSMFAEVWERELDAACLDRALLVFFYALQNTYRSRCARCGGEMARAVESFRSWALKKEPQLETGGDLAPLKRLKGEILKLTSQSSELCSQTEKEALVPKPKRKMKTRRSVYRLLT